MAYFTQGTNEDGTAGPQYHLLNPEHCWVQVSSLKNDDLPMKDGDIPLKDDEFMLKMTILHRT